jgi:hypothetical protein
MENDYLRYVTGASQYQLYIYYSIVAISFLFLLYKYRKSSFQQYIILLFFGGLVSFIGKYFHNIYYIIRTILTVHWLDRTKSFQFNRKTSPVIIGFFFFTIIFIYAAMVNKDYFTIIFSQYSKYFIVFSLFLILMRLRNDDQLYSELNRLCYDILRVQIFLSVVKFLLIGTVESIVGSISALGGAVATPLPILGFMFIWLKKQGDFNRKDWFFIAGLLFIGFVSYKRAIWIIMPIIISSFMFYIIKAKVSPKVIFVLLFIPLVFYMGVRMNWSLNPERKIWGSFNFNYVYTYSKNYMFGTKERMMATGLYYGRGGANLLLYNKMFEDDLESKDWLGYGLRFIYTTSYKEFKQLNFGIHSLGAASGSFQSYVANGYLGIITFVIFSFFIILKTRNNRLRNCLLFFFYWEYFFYTGIIFRYPPLAFLLIFIIVCSPKYFSVKKSDIQYSVI